MNELIKIEEKNGEQLVSARELHGFLEVKSRFNLTGKKSPSSIGGAMNSWLTKATTSQEEAPTSKITK